MTTKTKPLMLMPHKKILPCGQGTTTPGDGRA